MQSLTVALLQMDASANTLEASLAKGEAFCQEASRKGADIALFPELWNTGYTFPDFSNLAQKQAWLKKAIDQNDPYISHFRELAQSLSMAIGLTYLERWPNKPRNTFTLIDRWGQTCLSYAKLHTCAFDVEAELTPGQDFPVCSLDTAAGEVKIGAMICFDREFPESARILMLKGAEIILVPNACELEINRISQLRARSFENMVGIAIANYAAPKSNGHSLAFDGMAFNSQENSRDMLLVEAGEEQAILLAHFDLDQLRRYREHEVWGNAYRRPECYSVICTKPEDF